MASRPRISIKVPLVKLLYFLFILLLAACGGGGGNGDSEVSPEPEEQSSNQNNTDDVQEPINARNYIAPGQYASIENCIPFEGSGDAELKVVFINLDDSPHFDEFVSDTINNQFKVISPFDEYFPNIAFYTLNIEDAENYNCSGTGGSLSGSGFVCDNEKINQAIEEQCSVDDIYGIIKIVITKSEYGGSGGEVIYVGDNPNFGDQAVSAMRNTIIHEVGHNLGLADLYGGGFYFNGDPMWSWPTDFSRQFLNVDGPGCSKWCNTFKPAFEYNSSISAACHNFKNKQDCLAFNRDSTGSCDDEDGDSEYDCCVWSETDTFEYFESHCAPAWGMENIGLDCLDGAGCYFGAVYGNYAWRPVKSRKDSIMYSPTSAFWCGFPVLTISETPTVSCPPPGTRFPA